MNSQKIVTNIKLLRELKGISRKEIAEKLNIGVSGYSKIERGEVDISLNKFEQIAKILGYNMIEIIAFEPKELLSKNTSVISKINYRKRIQLLTMNILKNILIC